VSENNYRRANILAAYHSIIEIGSNTGPSFHEITAEVIACLKDSGIKNGIVLAYTKHTTCSVFTQEDSFDTTYKGVKFLLQDYLNIMDKIIPMCRIEGQYLHPGPRFITRVEAEGEKAWWHLNTDAHLRAMLLGKSENIPVNDGKLELGEFARIYLVNFDHTRARKREVFVQIIGEQ
jgi:thiamine phosphate synthase YjbQ (UPF0047 family)